MSRKLKDKKILFILGIIILVAGTLIAVLLTRQQQESRSRASEESVTLLFSPEDQDVDPNTEFTVNIQLESGNFAVTGVDFTFKYNPQTADFVSFTPSDKFNSKLIGRPDANAGTYRYSAVDTSSDSITGSIAIGELKLKSKESGDGQVTLESPQVTASGRDTAVPVNNPSPANYLIIEGDPIITDEPTISPDPTEPPQEEEPTATPTQEPSLTPTQTPTNTGGENNNNNTGGSNTGGSSGSNNTTTNNTTTSGKLGDLNNDGKVNIFDLSIMLRNWNKSGTGDLNKDGKVNIFDLSIMLRNWNK